MPENNFTIHNVFSNTVSNNPDKVALQFKKNNTWQRFTYKELRDESLKLATFLTLQGFKKGKYAALILENRPEWPIIYLGMMFAGSACVPLNPELSLQELSNFLKDCDAKIIFCTYELLEKKISQDLRKQLDKIVLLDAPALKAQNLINFENTLNTNIDKAILPDVSENDTASLVYTSGTTAQSKGVILTHRNFCSNARSIRQLNIVTPSDNTLSILPLYHTYSFMATMIMPLFTGAKITYFPLSFKPADLGATIREAQVSILIGVPQLFSLLYKAIHEKVKNIPFILQLLLLPILRKKLRSRLGKSLRLLVSGGARLEPEIGLRLSCLLGVKLIEGYGLTETSPIVTLNPSKKIKFGSVGKPIPDVEIKIDNPDKSGIGEVLIKGPNVMSGYFKRPDLTDEVIKEGWFYSGDVGYIDKDGYLFLSARKKDVIVLSSGKNIYPEELGEHYLQSPYIKEICVLPKTEERFGRQVESLYAVVVPNLEYFKQRNEGNIQGRIRWELENLGKDLPAYKHIMGFLISKEELPRTALKKVKRYQVAQRFRDFESVSTEVEVKELSQEDAKILKNDSAKKIIDYLTKELKRCVNLNSHLELDLGIDSLTRVELGLGLEQIFSIKIPEELLGKIATVKELILQLSEIIDKGGFKQEKVKETLKDWSDILKEPPTDRTLKRIQLKKGALDVLIIGIIKSFLFIIFVVFWLLRIRGRNNLVPRGPYLMCPNHASYLDGFVVFCSLPFKCALEAFFLGYSDIFERPVFRWSIKLAHLIPIDPNTNLTEAMQAVSYVLRHNKIVCIFPEGRRSIDENIQEFKKGAGILIKELNIPVVPIYIKNSHKSWPRTSRFPRLAPLKVSFGPPLTWKELIESHPEFKAKDTYEAVACALRAEVLKLAR